MQQREEVEEIQLSEDEESALDAAWDKLSESDGKDAIKTPSVKDMPKRFKGRRKSLPIALYSTSVQNKDKEN